MRYCGRDFSETELTLIRTLIAEDPRRTRADLSRLACRAMHWLKPDGGLKDMSCRVAMLRMQNDGLIQLPPPRCSRPQANILISIETDPQEPLHLAVHEFMTYRDCNYGRSAIARTLVCGMNTSSATIILALKHSPVRNCAIGSMQGIAWLHYWDLAPPLGSARRATNS